MKIHEEITAEFLISDFEAISLVFTESCRIEHRLLFFIYIKQGEVRTIAFHMTQKTLDRSGNYGFLLIFRL